MIKQEQNLDKDAKNQVHTTNDSDMMVKSTTLIS